MLRILILGPYSGSILEVAGNIRRGMEMATEAALAGFAVLPCWWDWQLATRADLPMEWFKGNTLAWLPYAQAVLLTRGWEKSAGVADELPVLSKLGIPTFESVDELKKWRETECWSRATPGPTNRELFWSGIRIPTESLAMFMQINKMDLDKMVDALDEEIIDKRGINTSLDRVVALFDGMECGCGHDHDTAHVCSCKTDKEKT